MIISNIPLFVKPCRLDVRTHWASTQFMCGLHMVRYKMGGVLLYHEFNSFCSAVRFDLIYFRYIAKPETACERQEAACLASNQCQHRSWLFCRMKMPRAKVIGNKHTRVTKIISTLSGVFCQARHPSLWLCYAYKEVLPKVTFDSIRFSYPDSG